MNTRLNNGKKMNPKLALDGRNRRDYQLNCHCKVILSNMSSLRFRSFEFG
ncbi:hypothetical protein ACVWYN_002420 [Pedobacter sp. UYP24]